MEYAVLGGLLRRAFRIRGVGGWGIVVAAAAAVGALDELYQASVPGRYSSVYDWMADFGGAAIGSALAPILGHWWTGTRARLKGMVG